MSAGAPVVAVDAPGISEVVEDGKNGRLLNREDEEMFSNALVEISKLNEEEKKSMRENACRSAENYSRETCSDKALKIYRKLYDTEFEYDKEAENPWEEAKRLINTEWEILSSMTKSAGRAISSLGSKEK